MTVFFTVIGFMMLADALFGWANMEKIQPMINKVFPKINLKTMLLAEGLAGAGILVSQLIAHTS